MTLIILFEVGNDDGDDDDDDKILESILTTAQHESNFNANH